eukprot:7902311-Lingulodinium_polyedra.AAC.1
MLFCAAGGTWRVSCDRGIDHVIMNAFMQSADAARCRATRIEATLLAIGSDEVRARLAETAEGLPEVGEVDPAMLEELLLGAAPGQLRRRLRECEGLRRKAAAGGALDGQQARKLRGMATLAAAVRATLPLAGGRDNEEEAAASEDQGSDDSCNEAIAELIREGQRRDPHWWRRWARHAAGTGVLDPRRHGLRFNVAF